MNAPGWHKRKMAADTRRICAPLRPYDGKDRNSQEKAIEYARWLADRDGVRLPQPEYLCPSDKLIGKEAHPPIVTFEQVQQQGWKVPTWVAVCVLFRSSFEKVAIALPNISFDPSAPASVPEADFLLPLAA